MNAAVRLPSKWLLQALVQANTPTTRRLAGLSMSRWNRAIGNALGQDIGSQVTLTTDEARTSRDIDATIVYLARSRPSDLGQLSRSLKLLQRNLLSRYPYPITIFHEDIPVETQEALQRLVQVPISFEVLEFAAPHWLTPEIEKSLPWRLGYCHMCNFFSGEIFTHPALRGYDWYMRLDVDSYVLAPLPCDPFAALHARGKIYGYLTTFLEESHVCEGLADCVKEYVRKSGVRPTFLDDHADGRGKWDRTSLYTNFEIADLRFWRSAQFKSFWEFVKEQRGVYLQRWGDAPIHFIALALFAEKESVAKLTGIGYRHVNYFSIP